MRKHLLLLFAFVFASFMSLTAQPVLADPADDLAAVKTAFQNVNSVHITFRGSGRSGTLDMIGRNKMHWTMSNGMQLIAIGRQSWASMGGAWAEQPQPAMATTMMQRFRTLNLAGSDIRKNYTVTDKGMTTAAGVPAHKYHVVDKANGNAFDLFVGSNNLPVQYSSADGETWTFSQYNSVADIKPPA